MAGRVFHGLHCSLSASWKSPINLNQESHERLKRCHSEPVPGPKPKKPAVEVPVPQDEVVPEVIQVTKQRQQNADGSAALRVMFSQVENVEGLTKAVT